MSLSSVGELMEDHNDRTVLCVGIASTSHDWNVRELVVVNTLDINKMV